jgi:cystathionine beta-lyase/cystathionine gamma-synthase
LESHPHVKEVHYPFLESNPDYPLAARQQDAGGGTLSFEIDGGVDTAISVMNNLTVCTLAENLGATETLVTHPATMTHGDVDLVQRERIGITDGLIRLSVGLEDTDDVIRDLQQALELAYTAEVHHV